MLKKEGVLIRLKKRFMAKKAKENVNVENKRDLGVYPDGIN